jgi:hypothetical protein
VPIHRVQVAKKLRGPAKIRTMPSIDPFGGAQNAPEKAVRCAKPIPWVQPPAADQTPRVRSVQTVDHSAPYASTQCSAARIHTAGATSVPFRHVQLAVGHRARAETQETRTNTMPNSCRSGPAKRRKIQVDDPADALPPLPPPAEPPEHNASPAMSFGQPKKRKSLSTPAPAERCSAPAETDRPSSPAAVSFGQPKKRRSSSACPSFSLPAEVPEAMHLEESQPVSWSHRRNGHGVHSAPATQCPSQRAPI